MSLNERIFRDDTRSNKSSKCKLSDSKIFYGTFSHILKPQVKKINRENSDSPFNISNDLNNSDEGKANLENLPEITEWRRALTEDKPAIQKLQTLTGHIANLLYHKRNIDELIENSYFSIVQFDAKGELVSFTAYDSYPNIPSVPSFFWNDWLNNNYRLKGASARNVLFVHYMVWQPKQANRFLRLLLETSFKEFLHLKHIILVKPPQAKVPDFYTKYFFPVLPFGLEKIKIDSIQSLLVCLRTSIIHPLPIRTAFEEELDIILPVISNHNSKAIDKPYILDFINFLYQQEKKVLICEFQEHIAGIMILNLKLDLESLNEGYELAPFHGLRKRDFGEDDFPDRDTITLLKKQSSTKISDRPNLLISSEFLFSQMNWELMLHKINATESSLRMNESTDSLSTASDFSELSLFRLSSFDINKSETETTLKLGNSTPYHGKNDVPSKTGEIRVAIRTSISTMPHFYLPKYHGHSNAFVIDFFAVDSNKIDEKLCSYDFLEAAFKIVPDRDYCVLIIPTDFLPFPLLDLFVRVTPRPMSSFKRELYLCHKNSLSVISMTVRNTEKEDLIAVNNFLKNVDDNDAIYQDILNNCFVAKNKFKSFLLTVGDKIVGVSLLDCRNYSEHFHLYFDVADYTAIEMKETENQSILKHLILNPIYHIHARFFVRDIMRLADLNCLYYVYSEYQKDPCNMLTILGEFVPIKPRRKAGFDTAIPVFEGKKHEIPFSLYLMNTRLCGFTRVHMNIVIVVVGASRTALSFLESLIFGTTRTYVNYNNLICVTPHGLETEGAEIELKDLMFPIRDNFSRKYISMLSLETYVSFIYGVMTEINRSEKYIIVNNKVLVRYDYLILTCGLQYLTPIPKAKESSSKNSCKKDFRSSLGRFLNRSELKKIIIPKHPSNMFVINTSNDAKNALRSLQSFINKIKNNNQADKKIIIYGHDLYVFLTIHTLIKLGIPGELIVFIEPFPSDNSSVTLFNDPNVDQAVLESVKKCKVSYFTEFFLYDWSVNSDDFITSVTFHSKGKQMIIPCFAFFPFVQKMVSEITFNACRNAGLVYDGRLVINHSFRTNDNYIYGAGPFTRYARRYYASEQDHQFFNSTEVGQKLAHIITEKIDPSLKNETEKDSDLVPQMKAPLLLYCQLPEDFNLFVMRKPGKELDLETAYNFNNYGEVLTTGDCQMKRGFGYFRLHLGPEGCVESIICYTKDKIDYVNLASLYGLHERLLNNLLFRYDLALIPDFFSYFREPWAIALFHEDFQLLRECNYKAFQHKLSKEDKDNFYDKVVKEFILNKWQPLPDGVRQKLESEYQNSPVEHEIKCNILQFIECYKKDLPYYAPLSGINCMIFEKNKPFI